MVKYDRYAVILERALKDTKKKKKNPIPNRKKKKNKYNSSRSGIAPSFRCVCMAEVDWSWLDAKCSANHSSSPLLNGTWEREYNKRFMGQDKDRETSLSNYHHGQNKLKSGELV